MKKLLIVFLLFSIVLVFSSCMTQPTNLPTSTQRDVENSSHQTTFDLSSNAQNSPSISSHTTRTLPFTVKLNGDPAYPILPVLPISEKLAKLIKEDGSGIVHLGMQAGQAQKVLISEDVPFIAHTAGSSYTGSELDMENKIFDLLSFQFEDGSSWNFNSDNTLESVGIAQTHKGLKIGDNIAKMKQLYGEPQPWQNGDFLYYIYDYDVDKSISPDTGMVTFTIGVDKENANQYVNTIHIECAFFYEGGS
jgi:hypothetical protein